jgi:hypothetical protein
MLLVRLIVACLFSIASASVAFAQAPAPPQNLTQNVSGTTVTLTWSAPASGTVTGYQIEASVVPGGPLVASLAVAGTTLVVPNVPLGVYYVRARALNAGAASGPSNEVVVAVGGGTGCPAPPLAPLLIVKATGFNVSLNWSSSGGCAPTSYILQAGSAPGLANIAQVNAGGQLGLSAVAPAGTYFIRVIGSNAFGNAVSQELVARVAANNVTDTILPFDALFFDISLTQTGTYRGTLVWDDPSIDLDLYLTTPGCAYPPTGCSIAVSDQTGVSTELVVQPVRAGDAYRLWVDNFSNRATSFTIINAVAPAATTTSQQ